MRPGYRRILAGLLLAACLAPGTWLREPPRPRQLNLDLRFVSQPLPPRQEIARHLGAFELEGAWKLESDRWRFGGYSSLAGGTVRIHNPAGQTTAFVEFGRSAVEATTTASMPIPSGATEVFGVGPATTHIAGITAADTADLFITPGQGF